MNVGAFLMGLCLLPQVSIAAKPLNCQVGPVLLEIGGSNWQVSSCDDGRSLVFATVAGNPAMPFVFVVLRGGDKTQINGEGNGSKKASSAAFEQIRSMTEAQYDALVVVTQIVKHSP